MHKSIQEQLRTTGKKFGLTQKQLDDILKFEAEHIFEIKLKGGKKYTAYRVQHSNKFGPHKGGIRFHNTVNLDEVRNLAVLMSLKTALLGLPLGGAKGGVVVDPKKLKKGELEELSRHYARHITPHIGPTKDVPAPDVNTDQQIIDWMVDEYERLTGDKSKASFTGKSIELGGSEGRENATGGGGVIVLEEILKNGGKSDEPMTIAVQGLGNVGSHFALVAEAEHPNWRLIAVTDSRGGVVDDGGLSAKNIIAWKTQGNSSLNYKQGKKISNEKLVGLEVDVLILAALGDAVNKNNVQDIKAKYILELANSPVSDNAESYLSAKGVVVIPDIIANAGGVAVSYLEMYQNINGITYSESEINEKLRTYMVKATNEVFEFATKNNCTLKEAAFGLALNKLTN